MEFSYEIRRLALKYPADVVKKELKKNTGTTTVSTHADH
jgi:hypothetical protein